MATDGALPGDDRPIGDSDSSSLTVLRAIKEYKREAEAARRSRLLLNRRNTDAFLGRQDWSHKQPGQSQEFLPKTPMAVEQISAFVKRALTDFGSWFSLELPPNTPLTPYEVEKLIRCHLDHMSRAETHRLDFATLMSDAVKLGLTSSLVILKIHGRDIERKRFRAERGVRIKEVEFDGQRFPVPQRFTRLYERTLTTWRLLIDLIRPEDFLPDPTGRGLYEIHEVERDLADVVDMADAGIYDPDVVDLIEEDFARLEDEWRRARATNQDAATPPSFRKRIILSELWGTLLDDRGRVAERNIVTTMANDKYLIRPPEPNPFWHKQSPFVAGPLVRVPHSIWHKALLDHAVDLNLALNELFSLMMDGAIGSVWGIKQLRVGLLENPDEVTNGIPQGKTLLIKDETPAGLKVLEKVAEGEIPQDAITMYNIADKEFQTATLVNELKLGQFPSKNVKATEVVEAQQNSAVFFDGVVRDIEDHIIEPTLWKAWLTMLQHVDDFDAEEVVQMVGARPAMILARMSKAERFAAFAGCSFKVNGLSATAARAKDFQKIVALLQMSASNPLMLQAFLKRFDPDKIFTQILRSLNLDPESLEISKDDQTTFDQRLGQFERLQQATLPPGQRGQQGPRSNLQQETSGGSPELPAEVNEMVNPMTGLPNSGG